MMRPFELHGGIEVAEAEQCELDRFQIELPDSPVASLDDWHLLALRRPCGRLQLVACGLPFEGGPWLVTMPLNAVDGHWKVRTIGGAVYELGVRRIADDRHLGSRVRRHLEEERYR